MHIVAIAWMFVVVLMSAAEATSSQGSLLGAFFTLLLYGVLPLGIVLYILGTPGRKAARRRAEQAAMAEEAEEAAQVETPAAQTHAAQPASAPAGDAGGHAAGDAGQAVREKP